MKAEENFQRCLMLEDELNLATTLKVALHQLRIDVVHVTTIQEAIVALNNKDLFVDFLLLDRMLPDGDGIEVLAHARKCSFKGAAMVLSAKGETDERVEGLRAGADDYLAKPFSWEELAARIQALARRHASGNWKPKSEQLGNVLWARDPSRLEVAGPKGRVELTALEYKLMEHFVQSQGEIIERDTLLRNVWGFKLLPRTRTVDYFLGRLRKHFEENPKEPRHFLTVRGSGYRFEP